MLTLLACEPKVLDSADVDDADAPGDTATDTAEPAYTVVVTTTDYAAGALATIDGSTGVLTDGILNLGGDSLVHTEGDVAYIVGRAGENTVRRYTVGEWTAPTLEFSTGDGTNPYDVVTCGGKLWVALWDAGTVGAWDPSTGQLLASVDLAAFDDGDGSSNPDSLHCAPNGSLYGTLQRYNLDENTSDYGTLVKIDPATATVSASWTTVNNARFLPHADDATELWIDGGNYFGLDGSLVRFDTTTDTLDVPVWTEADLGRNVSLVSGSDGTSAIMVTNDGETWEVWCLSLADWSYSPAAQPGAFIGGGAVSPDGKVWLTYAEGFSATVPTTVEGVVAWDPATCSAAAPLRTALPAYSLAVAW